MRFFDAGRRNSRIGVDAGNSSTDAPKLLALLNQVAPYAQPERLGYFILKADPQFHRLTAEESEEVVRTALELGTDYAKDLAARHGTKDPMSIATHLGIKVETSDNAARYGNVVQYAEYRSRPPQVRLYRKSLEGLNQLLEDPEAAGFLGLSDVTSAFLAHELFHHLDNLPDRTSVKRARTVLTINLGPWRVRSGLITAPEIAAGSFAQSLLQLPFHLKLLDLLAVYSVSPARAANWVRALE